MINNYMINNYNDNNNMPLSRQHGIIGHDDIYYKYKYLKYKKKYIELKNNIIGGGKNMIILNYDKNKDIIIDNSIPFIIYLYDKSVDLKDNILYRNKNHTYYKDNLKYKFYWIYFELNDYDTNTNTNIYLNKINKNPIIIIFDLNFNFTKNINLDNLLLFLNNKNDNQKIFLSAYSNLFERIFNLDNLNKFYDINKSLINLKLQSIKKYLSNSIFIYINVKITESTKNKDIYPTLFFINIINYGYFSTFINEDLYNFLLQFDCKIFYYNYNKSGLIKDFFKDYKQTVIMTTIKKKLSYMKDKIVGKTFTPSHFYTKTKYNLKD
jgi:hypothetical protein